MCEFCDEINTKILKDKRVSSKIKSILRKNLPTIEEHLVELAEWYEGNNLTPDETVVAPKSKFLRHGFGHNVEEFYPKDMEKSDTDSITIEKRLIDEMITAIDDWTHQYASEMCDETRVKETYERISDAGGTLAYQAKLTDKLRKLINEE